MVFFGVTARPEMEFLDISLTKVLSLLLHAVYSLLLAWRIKKKSMLFSGFKYLYKKIP